MVNFPFNVFAGKACAVHKDIKEILFAESEIKARVDEIGGALTDKYSKIADAGEPVVLISVLRGAAIFMADLARATEIPLEMDYMAVSSYGSGTKSSGVVKIIKDLTSSIDRRRHPRLGPHARVSPRKPERPKARIDRDRHAAAQAHAPAGRHPSRAHRLRMPRRVHRRLRPRLRRAVPQPAIHRHPET